MMRREMNHVVADIAEEKAGKRSWRQTSEDAEKQSVKNRCNRKAKGRRRDQPAGILGIIVVHAMHEKVEFFSPTASRFVMKKVAVHRVFDQGPDDETERKQTRRCTNRQTTFSKREIQHVGDHRQEDHQWRYGVDVRKTLDEIVLEHPDRFIFVGDVTLRHTLYHAPFRDGINGLLQA